jgi:hypothetical protein
VCRTVDIGAAGGEEDETRDEDVLTPGLQVVLDGIEKRLARGTGAGWGR